MKTATPVKPLDLQKMMIAIYIWLRIVLSYCVVGAVITTLVSAFIQAVNLPIISVIMTISLCIGVYKAEVTRRDTGLNSYFVKLSNQKHSDF
ncbi:hypothetical protein [Colwellia sp. C1TZA3]|uniref:hypothetical protein n=1 Tax=Colwellia sp. C1TZA3 TaxID=2508879 RepID=UPI0011B9FC56|nr:hypothetical protein [Colwellia sp. C1TZA3]TWX72870.1 hypothetical protein ESZ39_06605 [Colwellia sp. C1TZA3]